MQLDDYEEQEAPTAAPLEEILDVLLADACSRGLTQDSVVYRDLFDTKLMNALMPRPSQVREAFWKEYKESPEKATEYFYKLSQDSNYIRRYRVCKDMKLSLIHISVKDARREIQRRSDSQQSEVEPS